MVGIDPDHPIPGDLPFNPASRQVLADARSESDRLRHEYIGTEHLVLGLTRQADDVSILAQLGVNAEKLRDGLGGIVQRGRPEARPADQRPYTERTKRIFAFALESARSLGHAGVEVDDLLIGMLRERTGIAAQLLYDHGLTLERAIEYAQRRGTRDRDS